MKKLLLIFVISALSVFALAKAAETVCNLDGSSLHSLRVIGLCSSSAWIIWRVPSGDAFVACAGTPIPVGAVELREFYPPGTTPGRFNASVRMGHQDVLSRTVQRLRDGAPVVAQDVTELGNLAGALNLAAAQTSQP